MPQKKHKPTNHHDYQLKFDPDDFLKSRLAYEKLVLAVENGEYDQITPDVIWDLYTIANLMCEIAHQAHDRYKIDCLLPTDDGAKK
jgi:hypothetical protein